MQTPAALNFNNKVSVIYYTYQRLVLGSVSWELTLYVLFSISFLLDILSYFELCSEKILFDLIENRLRIFEVGEEYIK